MKEYTLPLRKEIDPIRVARFWSKVAVTDDHLCWNWRACIGGNGYGQFKVNRYALGAHVVSYLIIKGNIPKGKHVCHTCDNTKCCNPNHLWLGTIKDNAQDKILKGRDRSIVAIRKNYAKQIAAGGA